MYLYIDILIHEFIYDYIWRIYTSNIYVYAVYAQKIRIRNISEMYYVRRIIIRRIIFAVRITLHGDTRNPGKKCLAISWVIDRYRLTT